MYAALSAKRMLLLSVEPKTKKDSTGAKTASRPIKPPSVIGTQVEMTLLKRVRRVRFWGRLLICPNSLSPLGRPRSVPLILGRFSALV